jgi:hypothetical protein
VEQIAIHPLAPEETPAVHDAKAAHRIRVQIEQFAGKLSVGLPKVAARMVREVLYGVQARGSVRLSEIARSLGEGIGLKKVIERLGRQLGRVGLRERLEAALLGQAARFVADETLLVIDPTDLSKPYARKMEHLAEVRDGSAGTFGPGYWAMTVVAAERRSARIVPLYQELYSQAAPGFDSENRQILQAIDKVAAAVGGRGIWVMDRGGDRRRVLLPLVDSGRRFLVRMRGDRHLLEEGDDDEPSSAFALAAGCRLPYRENVVRQEPGGEQIWPLRFGARRVRLPERPDVALTLVVVEGPWSKPLVLLTTLRPGRSRRSHWRLVETYLARWRVEEAIRFVKQSYQLEDIRLLRYERLRTMVTLVTAVAFFTAVVLGKRAKLRLLAEHLLRSAQRIYGVPEFRYYALADGIKQLLYSSQRRPSPLLLRPGDQLLLLPFG